MSLFLELNNLMVKYSFRPEKRRGQNFITSEETIQLIVDSAELVSGDRVLEIGAGSGFLTRELVKKCKTIAIEKDERLCELIEQELSGKNLELICGDYLKEKVPSYNKVVSFPPYFISKKVMLKILSEKPELGVLVFQSEFAEKLVAMPGFKEYCALSILCQHHYNVKTIGRVKAKKFFPKPKSDSSIVLFKEKKEKLKVHSEHGFEEFVEQIFRHKNKNLSNALENSRKFLGMKRAEKILKNPVLSEKVSQLTVKELVTLYNELASSMSGNNPKKS